MIWIQHQFMSRRWALDRSSNAGKRFHFLIQYVGALLKYTLKASSANTISWREEYSSEHDSQNQLDRIFELVNTLAISESDICVMTVGWKVVKLWYVSTRWACNGQNWAFNRQNVAFIWCGPHFFPRIQEIQTCTPDILVPLCQCAHGSLCGQLY